MAIDTIIGLCVGAGILVMMVFGWCCYKCSATKRKPPLPGEGITATENEASRAEAQRQHASVHYDVRRGTSPHPTQRVQNQADNTTQRPRIAVRLRTANQHTEGVSGQANDAVSRPPPPSYDVSRRHIVQQVSRYSQNAEHGSSFALPPTSCDSQHTQGALGQAGGGVSRQSPSNHEHQASGSSQCPIHTPIPPEAPPSYNSIFGQAVYSPVQVHSAADQRHQLSTEERTVSVIEILNTPVLVLHTVDETSQVDCSKF